jgi:hypothetical protein
LTGINDLLRCGPSLEHFVATTASAAARRAGLTMLQCKISEDRLELWMMLPLCVDEAAPP